MKRVAILFFGLVFGVILNAQILTSSVTIYTSDYTEFDISKIADDTTYWFRVRGKSPIDITVDFSNFSGDDAVVDVYKGSIKGDSIYYGSIDGLIPIDLPITLVRATYQSTSEGDTTHTCGVMRNDWRNDLVGVYLDPNSMTGTAKIIIDR